MRDGAHGVAVAKVTAGSPAAKAGLAAGDVVSAVDGSAVHTADELAGAVASHQPGDRIGLDVRHGSTTRTVTVVLGDVPAST